MNSDKSKLRYTSNTGLYLVLIILVISIVVLIFLVFQIKSYLIGGGIIFISTAILVWGLRMIMLKPIFKIMEETKGASLRLLSTDEELRELTKNLQAKNEEAMKLNSELERKASELEAFNYSVFHDLKSPLISIKGFISLLDKKYANRLGGEWREYLESVLTGVTHMSNLVHDLLELSRVGQIKLNLEHIDMEELIAGIRKMFNSMFIEKNIKFVIHTPLPRVYGDIQRINQLFENLISNAIKFSAGEKESLIEIGSRQFDNEFVEYFVKDNGIGIAKEDHEKVFRPFFRLNEANVEGTGIGLAVVKKVVELHGGKIWIESEKGIGTTFCFTLPIGNLPNYP